MKSGPDCKCIPHPDSNNTNYKTQYNEEHTCFNPDACNEYTFKCSKRLYSIL